MIALKIEELSTEALYQLVQLGQQEIKARAITELEKELNVVNDSLDRIKTILEDNNIDLADIQIERFMNMYDCVNGLKDLDFGLVFDQLSN